MLNSGDEVVGSSGPVRIGKQLGVGGQGTVFEAVTADGHNVALKWYSPQFQRSDLRASISDLVVQKAPSEHFLWPDDIVLRGDDFGYTMGLRPPDFANIPHLLKRRVDVKFRELVRAATQIVSAFRALQGRGLAYGDISDGNVFFRPATGDVLICDNDNVAPSGSPPRVLGTPRFMAPEIVRGDAPPSTLSDLFSMSVLLFLLLFNDHPLQGKAENDIRCFDAAAMRKLYGTNPVFIFDPENASNRPVPGVHLNAPIFWGMYPEMIKKIFTTAFTVGLDDPGRRPAFGEWQAALIDLEDSIVVCECGKQSFLDVARGATVCWKCSRAISPPMRIVIHERRTVMLNADTELFAHHLVRRGGDAGSRGEPCAAVVKHPTQDIWGLKNLTPSQWFARTNGGEAQVVSPGRSATLRDGTVIDFGDVTGRITV